MKEVRSNMTIAVIIVYLSCHEEESSWRKIIRVLLFSASLNLRARCFLYGALCLFPPTLRPRNDRLSWSWVQTDNPTKSTHPSGRKTHYGAKKSCQHPITNRPIHGQYLVGKVFESITTVFLSLHRCRIQKKSSQSVVWLLNLINLRRWSQKGEPTS